MTDKSSLLSYIARRHSVGREDVATSALSFILSRSESARQALSDFISDCGTSLQVAETKPWGADALRASPDLACRDDNGDLVALIESKFWAGLTHHQPATYWKELPDNRPAVLLFLAPAYRVNAGGLWDELTQRLSSAGHELGHADRRKDLVTSSATNGQRRLVLASWDHLLDKLAQSAKEDRDEQASFEIAELKGLAADVTAAKNPRHDENLKKLIADAINRVEQFGWADTDGLTVGQGFDYYGRYLRLAGASAWFGIDYKAVKQMPEKPVWLAFYNDSDAAVSRETVRSRLGELTEPGFVWGSGFTCVPIALPDGVDTEATCHAIVAELKRIAKLIDPDGPTYREPPAQSATASRNWAGQLKLLNWNVEWASPRSPRRAEILRRIYEHEPEVVCLTETHDGLLSQTGHTVSSQPDYGYPIKPHRRKVMLWSKEPWQQVDDVGVESMPPGRFVSGVTQTSLGQVTVLGICIPWHASRTEKRRGCDRKKAWQDHRQYLADLTGVLERMAVKRLIVTGDFNQIIGAGSRAPRELRLALEKAFGRRLAIVTSALTFKGREAIDHVALSDDLAIQSLDVISNIDEDRKLSDHFGVVADITERLTR